MPFILTWELKVQLRIFKNVVLKNKLKTAGWIQKMSPSASVSRHPRLVHTVTPNGDAVMYLMLLIDIYTIFCLLCASTIVLASLDNIN